MSPQGTHRPSSETESWLREIQNTLLARESGPVQPKVSREQLYSQVLRGLLQNEKQSIEAPRLRKPPQAQEYPDEVGNLIFRVLRAVQQVDEKVERVGQDLADHHTAMSRDVKEVKDAVFEGNQLLKAMRAHPAATVSMFASGLIFCSVVSLFFTIAAGWAPLSPGFALFCLFAGLAYRIMVFFHGRDAEKE